MTASPLFRVVERTADGGFAWATRAMPENRARSIHRKMLTADQYEAELGHELFVERATDRNRSIEELAEERGI